MNLNLDDSPKSTIGGVVPRCQVTHKQLCSSQSGGGAMYYSDMAASAASASPAFHSSLLRNAGVSIGGMTEDA